ncbi:MAG: Lrp/AsnC family transcriptional regulator [Candidatus Micrarchaeota archaeon]|nr:Lrp/AsnC family transcriptional regulator [Candidatus Micrarchaeota archaeon]
MQVTDFGSKFDESYGILTRKMMRFISEDSRISILELSKKLGVSRRTARERLLKAEREFGIRYTVAFSETALQLSNPHIILVKFIKKPDWDEVARLLSSSYIPQIAAVVKGDYDMFIYANAITSKEYVHWDKGMQILLSKYGVAWHPSNVAHKQLGFFPLRNEILDRLAIDENYKKMLKLLNINSRITFSEISKRIGMHFNTVAYNFKKLVESGYIRRFTISLEQPRDLALISTFSKYILSEGFEDDATVIRKVYTSSGTEYPIISRYLLCTQLVGSYDSFVMGIFDNYNTAYKQAVVQYKSVMKRHKTKVECGQVQKVLLGRLPIRSIDTKKEYNTIKWTVEGMDAKQK